MKRLGLVFSLVVLAGAALLPRGLAQSQADNPHGDIKQACADCHTAEGWTSVDHPKEFHHQDTGFTLEGLHADLSCRSCHKDLVFSRVGTACADCHRDAHKGELGFRCESCHSPRTWSNRSEMFQAHNRTPFPLFAVHANVDCDACHRGQQPNQYVTTPSECGQCHLRTFELAVSPNHVLAGFSRRCEDCHAANSPDWHRVTYRHPDTYPLLGAHVRARCGDCHKTAFAGTPRDCVTCHRNDYNATTNPNHRSAGFPTTCQTCHSTNAWRPASSIDHNRTGFPLTGAHQGLACDRCHVGGRFAGTPKNCVACHQADYNGARNPDHSGFPTTCESCHSTGGWRPASFDHNRTGFPLTGAHRGTPCNRCHSGGYAGTPSDCYACHASNYDGTTNPNHRSANFPTQCASCHSTTAWRPASFNHDGQFFPIYSGRHRGVWSSCQDCHVSPGNFGAFECITCHAHSNQGEMANRHHEVGGYVFNSQACYRCHPSGRSE